MLICNDLDLALLEPTVARECQAAATLVWQGTVDVAGTTVTTAPGALASPPVEPGMLAYFPAAKVTALFVRRDSATASAVCALTARVTNGDFPSSLAGYAGPGDGTGIALQVFTFPQLRPASDIALDALALSELEGETQFDARAIRRAGAYLGLAMIFRSMATFDRSVVTASNGTGLRYNTDWRLLAEHYQGRYDREIRRVRPWVDADGDGAPETVRDAGVTRLTRG